MISIVCTHCGFDLEAPDELAGRQTRCSKCGNVVWVPISASYVLERPLPPPLIEVLGSHEVAVQALRDLLSPLAASEVLSNPFSQGGSHLAVAVEAVVPGSAVVRYLLLSFVGRPRVTIRFAFRQNGNVVVERTLRSSAYFQDRQAAGFRGGAFGGSDRSFIVASCRKLTRRVVQEVVEATGVPASHRKECYRLLGR